MWLKVHRGIGLTSRAVDVWAAAPPPPETPPEDIVGTKVHASAYCVFSLLLEFKE